MIGFSQTRFSFLISSLNGILLNPKPHTETCPKLLILNSRPSFFSLKRTGIFSSPSLNVPIFIPLILLFNELAISKLVTRLSLSFTLSSSGFITNFFSFQSVWTLSAPSIFLKIFPNLLEYSLKIFGLSPIILSCIGYLVGIPLAYFLISTRVSGKLLSTKSFTFCPISLIFSNFSTEIIS